MRQTNQAYWLTPPDEVEEGLVWLAWLVRLRWLAVVAQIITLSFSFVILDRAEEVLPALGGVIACLVAGFTLGHAPLSPLDALLEPAQALDTLEPVQGALHSSPPAGEKIDARPARVSAMLLRSWVPCARKVLIPGRRISAASSSGFIPGR